MFMGVKRAYVLLVLYIMQFIERYGTDEALEILEKASKKQGKIIAQEMMREISDSTDPLELGAKIYRKFMSEAGAQITEHKRDKKSVTFIVKKCPFYEVFLDVGIDCGMFLNGLCSNLTLPSIQYTLNEFDPQLRIENILTRESAEEICLERIHLEEN
jgi:predicted ArsR family transcriptional regulator